LDKKLNFYWTEESTNDLKNIFDLYIAKSATAAKKIIFAIQAETESIKFPLQNQADEFNPKYRRKIIKRHFRVIYIAEEHTITIVRVFDNRQNPSKMKK